MAKKIKKYRIKPDESLCLAISVVDRPAVETDFICLSEQRPEQFVAVDKKERKMIYGCALRADFPIYRNNKERGEYYIEFDADAIDKISKDFMKNGFQKNWTVGHESEIEGLTLCESWIKESPTLDKSIYLGLDSEIPVGSWFLGCYCENDDIWNAVKEGKYHGFSCEAVVALEEFESQIEVDTEDSEANKVEHLEEQPTVEAPTEPTVEPQNEPKVEEPITTPSVEEKPSEEPTVEPPKVAEPNPLEDLVKNLKEEIEALKGVNKDLTSKVKSLEKEPSTKPHNTNAKHGVSSGVDGSAYQNWREQMRNMMGY